jgi:hypothetical protein
MAGISDDNFGLNYDKEKYNEMLLDAAESVLGIFGFDRTWYDKPKDKRWWMELKRNNINDVRAEARVALTLIAYLVSKKIRQLRERRNKAGENSQ